MTWFRDLRTSRFAQALAFTATAAGAQTSAAAQGRPKAAISEVQTRAESATRPTEAVVKVPPFPLQSYFDSIGGPFTPGDRRDNDPFYGSERARLTMLSSRWKELHALEGAGKLTAADRAELEELRSPPHGLGSSYGGIPDRYDLAILGSWLRLCSLARNRASQGQPGADRFDAGDAAAYASLKAYPANPKLAELVEAEARGTLTDAQRNELPFFKMYPRNPAAAYAAVERNRAPG